jgi:RNA polymerase sigma factor (sigma-70 family)
MGENFLIFLLAMSFHDGAQSADKKNLRALAERVFKGETQAAETLLRLLWPKITRLLQIRLGTNNADWKDVRQKCCLEIWQGFKDGKYDEQRASVGTYVAAIVNMQIKSYFRDKGRRQHTQAHDPAMLERIGLMAEDADMESEVEKKERKEHLRRCLNELPENQRIIMAAAFDKAEDHKTLAARLGLKNAQQVAELKRNAKTRLRQCLEKYYPA